MAKSGERPQGAVRVTAPAAQVARRAGVTLEVARLQSGVSYLRVFRGDTCLGELWRYDVGGRWRVLPLGLPRRYRCYCTTQPVAVSALVQAHAACPASAKETPVPWSVTTQINDRIRHITLVRNACVLLGQRQIERGEVEDGWELIARGHRHDGSKWYGIERKFLHAGPDVDKAMLALAMHQHQSTNDHHPEFWIGGIHAMSRWARAEMVCDWYARSQERGTGLRDWITQTAMGKFGFKPGDDAHKEIMEFVELLLQDPFVKVEG